MKARVFPYLLPFCVFFLFACGPTASRGPADAITFDTARQLDDFDFAASNAARAGEWLVIDNDAGRGLARTDTEPNENRFSFAIYRRFFGHDVYVSTRFITISGNIDQAAGLVVRFRSPDDYYAVRANVLENNVCLYRVVAGRRWSAWTSECWAKHGTRLASRRAAAASRYFSMTASCLSRLTGGCQARPAKLDCGLRPIA